MTFYDGNLMAAIMGYDGEDTSTAGKLGAMLKTKAKGKKWKKRASLASRKQSEGRSVPTQQQYIQNEGVNLLLKSKKLRSKLSKAEKLRKKKQTYKTNQEELRRKNARNRIVSELERKAKIASFDFASHVSNLFIFIPRARTEPINWFRPVFQGFQGQDFKITSRSPLTPPIFLRRNFWYYFWKFFFGTFIRNCFWYFFLVATGSRK